MRRTNLAPPPPSSLNDELGRIARQVRRDLQGSPTHTLVADWTVEGVGVHYRTTCGKVLTHTDGAMLTTRETTCIRCISGDLAGKPGPKPGAAS